VNPLVIESGVAAEAVAASGDRNATSAAAPAANPIARRLVIDLKAMIPFSIVPQ
jgi:hypothetical protein